MLGGRDFIVILIGSILFALLLSNVFPQEKTKEVTFISPLVKSVEEVSRIIVNTASGNLAEVVDESMQGTTGTYGIVIKNLRTGETYTQNENRKFQPASLYKLWVMGTTYKQLNAGTLSMEQKLTQDVEALNKMFDIDSEFAERTEGTVSLTIQEALEKMITISDNYAAYLLVSKVRNSNISTFMKEEGLINSKLGQPPQTTPLDIASFYEKLYSGTVVNSDSSRQMIETLERQQLNDRIPKYLPEDIDIAHKTGEIEGFKHDAGIIFAKDPILFVVLSESNNPLAAAEREAKLSKAVYDYFESK